MNSTDLLTATRTARKAAMAAEKAGDTAKAAQIRARAAELSAHLNDVVAAESASRRAAEIAPKVEGAALWNQAMSNLIDALNN